MLETAAYSNVGETQPYMISMYVDTCVQEAPTLEANAMA